MEFYAQNGKQRPVRLSEATRKFAYESLNRKYGLDTLKTFGVSCEDVEEFDDLSDLEKHDLAIKMIAEQAPIRICETEKISGAATLAYAIYHRVPAYKNNDTFIWGISHLTVGFDPVLKHGINGIRKKPKNLMKNIRALKKKPLQKVV